MAVTFSSWLKSEMQQRGMKPPELAGAIGTTNQTIHNWLRGTKPDAKWIRPLSVALDADEGLLMKFASGEDVPANEIRQAQEARSRKDHDLTTIGARIAWVRKKARLTQAEIAESIGQEKQSVSQYETGRRTPDTAIIQRLAAAVGVSFEWLATGQGEPALSSRSTAHVAEAGGYSYDIGGRTDNNSSDLRRIKLVSTRASAGPGAYPAETEEVETYVSFKPDKFRNEIGVNPDRVIAMYVTGNSMEPTLSPGEFVVIERFDGDAIRDSAIYVFRLNESIMVKRLYQMPGGELLIKSDNPDSPSFSISLNEGRDFRIIGRVVWGDRRF